MTGPAPVPVRGTVPAPRPLYLHVGEQADPVFGVFHAVEAGEATGDAVLLLPPFGYDDVCAYRGLRMWALSLSAEGVPSLRIDLPGSGDSGGSPRDPGRAESWTAAVAGAASWLRAETGARRVVAIALGLGGLIAAQSLIEGAEVDDLVLWGSPSRGKALVRELKAFARLAVSQTEGFAWDPDTMPPLPEGALESGGFLMTAETVAWLQGLDLAKADWPDATRRHVLLLGREGIAVDAKLHAALQEAGVGVTAAEGPGYTELMDEPHRSLAPEETFAVVSAWLTETRVGERPAPAAPAAVQTTPTAELTVDGHAIRETPIAIEAPGHDGALFGIIATPADPDRAADLGPLTVVFLNVGAERRIGANRMWLEAARRWAARGIPSARIDLIGIGEGGGPATPWNGEWALYDDALVEQVRIALDALPSYGLPAQFELIGMCSSSYWSFNNAVKDPRIQAMDLLNTRMLLFDDTLGGAAEVHRLSHLGPAQIWAEIKAGKLTWWRVRRTWGALMKVVRTIPGKVLDKLKAKQIGGDPLDLALDTLRDQGTQLSLRFTEGEPLQDELERSGHLGRLARWPNVTVSEIRGPADSHTLQNVRMQPAVHRQLDAFLDAQLARLRAS
ncbi:alpha/beta fold hydrolase [Baekduia sp. Peel2402]|uniref:alpha/beta fold hydrolase n=1 Tax=Baekduia sp. Peel2402 TaxID=3458296 RepID=UPI00403E38FE